MKICEIYIYFSFKNIITFLYQEMLGLHFTNDSNTG